MQTRRLFALVAGAAMLLPASGAVAADAPATTATPDPVLVQVVAGDWRTPEAKARDAYRHPVEALTFWGLKPGMTILEVQPGAQSWWTEILAPYAKRTGGKFYVTGPDLSNPDLPEGARKSRAAFEARYGANPDLYGKIDVVNWGAKSAPLPKDTFDFILTARSVHGWMGQPGMAEKTFKEFYDALKPGGILALEQHRANPGPQDPKAASGLRDRGLRDRAGEAGGIHAGGEVGAERESEGHEGSPVRRLDAAAGVAFDGLWLRKGRGPELRSLEVHRDRRVRPHDAQVRKGKK